MTYDEAIAALYRAPLDQFVAERKRLASELTRAGDKSSAALLAKHARPSVSAWAVNRLWDRDRRALESIRELTARLSALG